MTSTPPELPKQSQPELSSEPRPPSAEPSSTANQEEKAPPQPRKRRWVRWLMALVAFAMVGAASGPWLVSTSIGRSWLSHRISRETQLDIQLGSLYARWGSPIVVRDIKIATAAGKSVGSLEKLETSKTLWQLLRAGADKGELRLTRPTGELDLSKNVLDDLSKVVQEFDPQKGLIGKVANPKKDTRIRVLIEDAAVRVRPEGRDGWETIIGECSPDVAFERQSGQERLTIAPGRICHLQVSPVLCDWGLQYVLPVLAGAVNADGASVLNLQKCEVDLTNPDLSDVAGDLFIESIRAEVEGPILRSVTEFVVHLANENVEGPTTIHFTENCQVGFAVAEGRVSHEGLRFGLPRIMPALGLETRGSIGFDQSLDLYVESELPLDQLGDGPLLQRLGSPRLSIPIAGTFTAPRLEMGNGQVAKSLLQDLVDSAGGDESIDIGSLVEEVKDLELMEKLQEFRNRRKQRQEEAAIESDSNEEPESDDPPPGFFQRLRKRGGILRKRE